VDFGERHQPWQPKVASERVEINRNPPSRPNDDAHVFRFKARWQTIYRLDGLKPCGCSAPTEPGVVLDPFFGSGTVGVVAERHGRDWVGIELNPDYAELALRRIEASRRLGSSVKAAA